MAGQGAENKCLSVEGLAQNKRFKLHPKEVIMEIITEVVWKECKSL